MWWNRSGWPRSTVTKSRAHDDDGDRHQLRRRAMTLVHVPFVAGMTSMTAAAATPTRKGEVKAPQLTWLVRPGGLQTSTNRRARGGSTDQARRGRAAHPGVEPAFWKGDPGDPQQEDDSPSFVGRSSKTAAVLKPPPSGMVTRLCFRM